MFQEDEIFVERWESILNKCSLDLELALMERIQKELPTCAKKKAVLEQELRNVEAAEKFDAGRNKLLSSMRQFQEEVEKRKHQKFQRDGADYENDRVYRWAQTENPRHNFWRGNYRGQPWGRREPRQTAMKTSARGADTDSSTTSLYFLGGSQDSSSQAEGEGEVAGNIGTKGKSERPRRDRKRPARWW
ncbi:hypothetical protein XELAEV_18010825mg [Xenopus laevis]|uniref:Uncharacterized protein n=1 Tax=Xenopus laevis TaxID=8355 RepID=A0A974DWM5_XENLA|nr:hypothetical protein XELAEV_18010825mg [Xenopus laevis]